uniref:Uncharacterized protein n=1 Tax=Caulerpa lentillifera TaxID=148947 RepID=A0A2Z2QKX6_9CHLO|nr:hypothetical protein [Caulerpa lentillifera]AST24251.1 hypothetical protein [Caulerpa lentillifera]
MLASVPVGLPLPWPFWASEPTSTRNIKLKNTGPPPCDPIGPRCAKANTLACPLALAVIPASQPKQTLVPPRFRATAQSPKLRVTWAACRPLGFEGSHVQS